MVFFTSIIIILLLYFLEDKGILFATIIALAGEIMNLLLVHLQTSAVKKTMEESHTKQIQDYKRRVEDLEHVLQDMETLQEKNVEKISKAKKRIEELENETTGLTDQKLSDPEKTAVNGREKITPPTNESPRPQTPAPKEKKHDIYNHLPSGSNRKKLPI